MNLEIAQKLTSGDRELGSKYLLVSVPNVISTRDSDYGESATTPYVRVYKHIEDETYWQVVSNKWPEPPMRVFRVVPVKVTTISYVAIQESSHVDNS